MIDFYRNLKAHPLVGQSACSSRAIVSTHIRMKISVFEQCRKYHYNSSAFSHCLSSVLPPVTAALENLGYDGSLGLHISENLAELGLTIVNCTILGVPVGYAAGNVVGRSLANATYAMFQSSRQMFLNAWQITEEEYNQRIAEVKHEWNNVQAATIKYRTLIAKKSTSVEDPN